MGGRFKKGRAVDHPVSTSRPKEGETAGKNLRPKFWPRIPCTTEGWKRGESGGGQKINVGRGEVFLAMRVEKRGGQS